MANATLNARKRLAIETLEARFNLSGLSTLSSVDIAGLVQPSSSAVSTLQPKATQRISLNSSKISFGPSLVNNTSDSSAARHLVGSTTVTSTTTTSVPVATYSAISNAKLEGNNDIGYVTSNGAYVNYNLNVANAGTYNITVPVSSVNAGSTFDLYVNGAKATTYTVPNTGGWGNFTNVTQAVSLPAGSVDIRLQSSHVGQAYWYYNTGSLTVAGTGRPTTPTTLTGNAIALSSYSAIQGEQLAGGQLSFVSGSGSFVQYNVSVPSAGAYTLNVGASSVNAGSTFDVYVNGTKATTYTVPNTGSWSNLSTISQTLNLPAGNVAIKLQASQVGQSYWWYNIGSLSLSGGTTTSIVNPTTTVTPINSSGATTLALQSYSDISNSKIENNNTDIGWVGGTGAYVQYTTNVTSGGAYNIALTTASPNSGASIDLYVNGTKTTTFTPSNTGAWSNFSTATQNVTLPSGQVTLKFVSSNGIQYNIGKIVVNSGSATTIVSPPPVSPPPVSPPARPAPQPTSNNSPVSITTRFMTSFTELDVTGTSGNDSIFVTQSGNTITILANGKTTTWNGPFGDIVVQGGDGDDAITIDSSVNMDARIYGGNGNNTLTNLTSGHGIIVSVGGGTSTDRGNQNNTQYWTNTGDNVQAGSNELNGLVHKIGGYVNGVSLQNSGQQIGDPSGYGSVTRLTSSSLWGQQPSMGDVLQGQMGNCYLDAAFEGFANSYADKLRNVGVDLGDGTYAFQMVQNGKTVFLRIDGDLPAGGPYANGLVLNHPGSSGDQWAPLMEKAYVTLITGNSYPAEDFGWMSSVYTAFGFANTGWGTTGDDTSVFNNISSWINQGKAVTFGTNNNISNAPLIGDHAYNIVSASNNGGNITYTIRNPWGYDGAGSDSNPNDGMITITAGQLRANISGGVVNA